MDSLFGTIRLGTLITQLRLLPKDNPIRFDFCDFAPSGFSSYRGWYEHLAVSPFRAASSVPTGAFLEKLETEALNQRFTGYKGGSYLMTEETPVWVDFYDTASGTGIVAVHRGAVVNYIETKHIEV